jgi:phage terminase large subunit GpA-like protein
VSARSSIVSEPTTPPTRAEPLFDEDERRALRPLEQISPPAWAEKNRYLTRQQSKRSGPWRNANAPYLVAFMLLCVRRGVEILTILKHSQGGWSEAMRCVLGYFMHRTPDPVLLILPNREKGRQIVRDRIIPLVKDTPCLAELTTGRRYDEKSQQIELANGFVLRLGWSGSISSVASDPARVVICDERSKFEVDPKISIADSIEARTSTFDDPLVLNLSTPGADPDPTEELFNSANVKLYRFFACPHCGHVQRFTFDALRWEPHAKQVPDRIERATVVMRNRSAWIECENPRCKDSPTGGRIGEEFRRQIVNTGFWANESQSWKLHDDGREEGIWDHWRTVGMHAPAFMSLAPGHKLAKIAERFILAEGDPVKTAGVYNELFAEVYRPPTIGSATTSVFAAKCRPDSARGFIPAKPRLLPKWAGRLVMTVDTQKDHFYFVVRCFGAGGRSRRIHHGKASSFEELTALADESFYPYEDNVFAPMRVFMTGIDSAGGKMGLDHSRTDQVYRWCQLDPIRRKPLRGESEPKGDQPIRWRRVTYTPPDNKRSAYEVVLFLINVQHFQDLLASDITARIAIVDPQTGELSEDAADRWELNEEDDEEFNRHLSNMKKAIVKSRGRAVERWIPKTSGARHDYRDCEVYQIAFAHGPAQCLALPSFEQMQQMVLAAQHQPPNPTGVRTPDGRAFMVTRRK